MASSFFIMNFERYYRRMENTKNFIEETKETKSNTRKSVKDKKIEQLEKTVEANNKTIEDLRNMLFQLSTINLGKNVVKEDDGEGRIVEVGSRSIYPLVIGTADGHISYTFNCGDIQEIEVRELKEIFKNDKLHIKDLFKKGTLYFVDQNEYATFRIKDFINLDEAFYKHWLIEKTPQEAIEEFKRITNDKKDFIALHQLVYGIGYALMTSDIFKQWSYENRAAIEKYFGKKIEDVIVNIQAYEERPNKH